MENQEMVMEKSWQNILSSPWEPCQRTLIGWIPPWTNRLAVTKVVSVLPISLSSGVVHVVLETSYHRDGALLYIAYVTLYGLHLSLLTGGTAVCGHS